MWNVHSCQIKDLFTSKGIISNRESNKQNPQQAITEIIVRTKALQSLIDGPLRNYRHSSGDHRSGLCNIRRGKKINWVMDTQGGPVGRCIIY